MKFVQFTYNNKPAEIRAGYIEGNNVVDINKNDSSIPSTVIETLNGGFINRVQRLRESNPSSVPLSTVTLVAPVTRMDKVLCVGLNYTDHCKEKNIEPPTVPMFFSKFSSCVIGQNEPVRIRTEVTQKVDWEVELVIVIGKKCNNMKCNVCETLHYVFGYTVAQDITSRDWQNENAGQLLLSKAQDTFCPIGPWIVTPDEIGDPHTLKIKCSVNGVEKQSSNTSNLIHKVPDIIKRVSSVMTLLPGDIILTGTPAGIGGNRSPPEFLKPGDVIRSEIERIGAFEVKVAKF